MAPSFAQDLPARTSFASAIYDEYMTFTSRLHVEDSWLRRGDPTLDGTRVRFSADGIVSIPIVLRYAWPSEIDLMVHIAGLVRVDCWSVWNGETFTDKSDRRVSVYSRRTASSDT